MLRRLLQCFVIVGIATASILAIMGYFQRDPFITAEASAPPVPARAGLAAVYLSGDMGYRLGVGGTILRRLAADGIPVIGVNSVTFFRHRRTPAEVATMISEAARRALSFGHTDRLILIGHSFGADMFVAGLPWLPNVLRTKVSLVALVVPGRSIYYQVSPGEMFNRSKPDAQGIVTARLLTWAPTVCIYGQEEKDSLCPLLSQPNVRKIELPGGHLLHRDGNAIYDAMISSLGKQNPQ